MDLEKLRFPIGRFEPRQAYSEAQTRSAIDRIEEAPALLSAALEGLDDRQLDTVYRPDGWTLRQVAHHIPDSHLNSYVRFKWALTEDEPEIKAYFEDRWAGLPDSILGPVEISVHLLEALHRRWVLLLRSLTSQDLARRYHHPEWEAPLTVAMTVALYAWHGEHHVAHITSLREREGW